MLIRFFEENNDFSWFIVLVGVILIFFMSSLDFGGTYVAGKSWMSVAYHFSAFFCFGCFVLISVVQGRKKLFLFFTGFLISFGYAITDEIHQYFVPWRFCDFWDIYVDVLGITLAMLIYMVVVFWRD